MEFNVEDFGAYQLLVNGKIVLGCRQNVWRWKGQGGWNEYYGKQGLVNLLNKLLKTGRPHVTLNAPRKEAA